MVKTVVKTKEMNENIPHNLKFTKRDNSILDGSKYQYLLMDESGHTSISNIKQRWEIIKKEINER
jgi:hypothetical protein